MKFRIFILLLLSLLLLAGCGQPSLKQDIIGKWSGACKLNIGSNTSLDFSQIEFTTSGTAIVDGYAADYSFIDDQRFKLQGGIISTVLTASLNNNKLTLTDPANESCLLNHA